MENAYQKKILHTGSVQIHVGTPPITLIKNNLELKIERDYVKIKLCWNPTS